MAKTLRISDLLKLQLSFIDQLDKDTLSRLEPVLLRGQIHLRNELDKFAQDSFSYQQRRQTLASINRALIRIHNQHIREMESSAKGFNVYGREMAIKEVKNFNDEVGISTPNINKDVISLSQNDFLLNIMKASVNGHTI